MTNPLSTELLNSDPGIRSAVITPSDTADIAEPPRAVWVGVAGDIKATLINDVAGHTGTVFKNVPVGVWPFVPRKIYATGTGATDLVGAY